MHARSFSLFPQSIDCHLIHNSFGIFLFFSSSNRSGLSLFIHVISFTYLCDRWKPDSKHFAFEMTNSNQPIAAEQITHVSGSSIPRTMIYLVLELSFQNLPFARRKEGHYLDSGRCRYSVLFLILDP